MKDDTLERLLIDRALGALPADVDELLAAYIGARPEARAAARELDAVVAGARHVLSARPGVAGPPPPFQGLASAEAAGRRDRPWWPVSLAACLVIGVAIGTLAGRSREARPFEPLEAQRAAEMHPEPVVLGGSGGPPAATGASQRADAFWSASRFVKGAAGSIPRSPSALRWASPVSSPLSKEKS